MTTAIAPPTLSGAPHSNSVVVRARWAVSDTWTITKRNLLAVTRIPEALFFSTVQPIMFVLLFRYVFGGAIPIPGGVPYVDFMIPGIFVQAVMFGAVSTSVGLAEDLQKGLIERFRALPMARSAVLAGRTLAEQVLAVLDDPALVRPDGRRYGAEVLDRVRQDTLVRSGAAAPPGCQA